MSFYGSSFTFDGVPSEMYGLAIANIGGFSQNAANFGGALKIHEDRLNRRSTGLHYGVTANAPLSFPIAFTICRDNQHLDRHEAAAVAGWLTGHHDYKELTISQEDMQTVVYKCIITNLEAQEVGGWTVGFTATITCDGPYAYMLWPESAVTCKGAADYVYRNMSNVNDYYKPVITITSTGTAVTIENVTDGAVFSLSGMSKASRTITIDCLNQVITNSRGENLYGNFSGRFPRFLRGDNQLVLSGDFTMMIENRFPWNIGN